MSEIDPYAEIGARALAEDFRERCDELIALNSHALGREIERFKRRHRARLTPPTSTKESKP